MKQGETYVNGRNGINTSNPYSRNYDFDQNLNTFIPGIHEEAQGVVSNDDVVNETPVIGFLYSISRKGIGEYWPLHLGKNTIGRSEDCDIFLNEMSISDHHAVLSIKKMKTTGKLIATIRDTGSKNGMYLNDEELDYDNHDCVTNDIIKIGHNYRLLLLLIDAERHGLSIAENFIPARNTKSTVTSEIENMYDSSMRNIEGTVNLYGNPLSNSGNTGVL